MGELLQTGDKAADFLETPAGALLDPLAPFRPVSTPAEKPGGPYELIEQIGTGGCGIMYLSRQEYPLRREAALKVIKLGMDTRSFIARFEAERQAEELRMLATAKLAHEASNQTLQPTALVHKVWLRLVVREAGQGSPQYANRAHFSPPPPRPCAAS